MAVWNIKDLALPPIATYKANTKDIDIFYLRQVCRDAKQFFVDKRYMHTEYLILSRIVYRMKQKFRSSKDFKAVVKMYKTLDNYFKINMSAYINTFMELIPSNYEDNSTYLPTKNLIDYILVRHQGLVKLLVRVVETSKLAAHLLEERIHIGHSWQSAFTLFAIASRIYVLSKFIIQKACDFYQKLYPFSKKLKNLGADWLKSDYQLPKDLRQWLNIDWLDIDDEVKIIEEPELPRIIDFFDLVDDDDVQFCDEYIILDESLIDKRDKKKGKHVVEDSIKTLRGFDLEDEGEIIEVDSTIQNTSSNCDSSVKMKEKNMTISVNDTIHPRDDQVLDEAKYEDDNDDSSLTFGNISAIPNDITLNKKSADKFHSTAISPDEHSITQSVHRDDLLVPQSRSDDFQNNRNVSETSLSNSRIINTTTKQLEQKQNVHNTRALKETNNIMPSNSTTIDKSVEIIEKDITIISVRDSICPQDNAVIDELKSDHDNDVGVELSFGNISAISHDITLTEANVDAVHVHSKNVNNDCLCLSHCKNSDKKNKGITQQSDSKVMRRVLEGTKNKKQKGAAKIRTNSNENTLPSTSKIGKTTIESKKQKHTNTPSTPRRQVSNSTDYNKNMKEQRLNGSPECSTKTTDKTCDFSDFNVTIPSGYIVLSDSDDSVITVPQSSVLKQEESKFVSQKDCTDSYLEDSWFIDINRSKIRTNEAHQTNRSYTGESIFSSEQTPRSNKKNKKKRRTGDSNLLATSPKRSKFDRDPQADATNYQDKKMPKNSEPYFKVKSKNKRRGKSKRYFTMKIAE